MNKRRKLVFIGGGAIGVPAIDHAARMPEVGQITICDMDRFAPENLRGQAILPEDVGHFKAEALARRARSLRSDLEVVAHTCRVEDLPLGDLEGDLICTCVDNGATRVYVNEAAYRLGIPWVDGGVRGADLLARAEVYFPGEHLPCKECALTQRHYDSMEVRQPCQKAAAQTTAPTNSPSYLAAHSASQMAGLIHRVLAGAGPEDLAGLQVITSLSSFETIISRNRRNAQCRFDHKVFRPQRSGDATLRTLLGAHGSISAPGTRFTANGACPACSASQPVLGVRLGTGPLQRCVACGQTWPIHPAYLFESLPAELIPAETLDRSPSELGLRPGDLFSVCDGTTARHYLNGTSAGGNTK